MSFPADKKPVIQPVANSYRHAGMLAENFPEKITNDYIIRELLGTGSFGTVYRIEDKKNMQSFAVKTFKVQQKKLRSYNESSAPAEGKANLPFEIALLKLYKSPFIIKMIRHLSTSAMNYVIMEYMPGSDLERKIPLEIGLPEQYVKHIIYQVSLGLSYLHKNKIAHRDLKPSNILLVGNDWSLIHVKIADFGTARPEGPGMSTHCGTNTYAAPEIMCSHIKPYTLKVDIYSLGVIMFMSLTGFLPFETDKTDNCFAYCRKLVIPDYLICKEEALNLVTQMIEDDSDKRIGIDVVLQDQWFDDTEIISRVNDINTNGLDEIEKSVVKDSQHEMVNKRSKKMKTF